MTNISAIWQQAAHTAYQLSSPSCSTRAIQKKPNSHEKCLRVFWGKNPEKDNQQNNDKTEGAHGLEETEKRNQMTILRFQKRWEWVLGGGGLSLIHISEPTRLA